MLKKFRRLLMVLATAYLLALGLVFCVQRAFMYHPPAQYVAPEALSFQGVDEIRISTATGDEVPLWWHAPEQGEPVVIWFHGNGGSIFSGRFKYQHFITQGFGILAVEYPGYPGASGKPSEHGIASAADAGYEFLIDQGVSPDNIYLYGTSIGAGVAAQLAARKPVAKLVLEAPFYSMLHMVKLRTPIFGFGPLIKDKYESYRALEGLFVPVLWLHGTADRVIPVKEGQRLYDNYKGPKQKLIVQGGSHSNLWISGGREKITDFLKDQADHP